MLPVYCKFAINHMKRNINLSHDGKCVYMNVRALLRTLD